MPLLSVIIPVYNGSKYISETLNMVLSSEYKDLEAIVVNDGSTDNSEEIIKRISKDDNRVRLFSKENGGIVSSRNYGVEKAQGDYICFVDQDDFVKPFMYSKMIGRLEDEQSDLAICSSGRSVNGDESGYDFQVDGLFAGDDIRTNLLYPLLFNGYDAPVEHAGGNHYPCIWACVFRKSFWDEKKLKFRAYVNFEDDLLVKVEALAKAKKVSTISEIGYLWRVNFVSETYAHRYIENIGKKQDLEYNDILNSIKVCEQDENVINCLKKITYCKQYMDAIHYLSDPNTSKRKDFIKEYYEENIYSRDFEDAIEGYKYLKSGRIKPGIVLPLLARKKTIMSYRAEVILDRLLMLSLKSSVLTRMERRIKH